MCCFTVTLGIMSVLKITNQEPVLHNFVQGKSFLTGMAKALSSFVAVKKSSLAVSITFFKFFNFFYFGRSDLSLSATFHWPFSRDGQLVAIISYANDLSRFLSHFLTV